MTAHWGGCRGRAAQAIRWTLVWLVVAAWPVCAWTHDGDGGFARSLGWVDLLAADAPWQSGNGADPFADGWVLSGADARSAGEVASLSGAGGAAGALHAAFAARDVEVVARVVLTAGGGLFVGMADGPGALLVADQTPPPGTLAVSAGVSQRVRLLVKGDRERVWIDGRLARERRVPMRSQNAPVTLRVFGPGATVHDLHARDVALPVRSADALSAAPGLPGWKALGDALWSGDGRTIDGRVDGGGQSFLMSERAFGDFVFEVDLLVIGDGNSGVQIRSHVRDNGRLFGYQVEIDPSPRAWSAGIYDEARRGWLDDLKDEPLARAAFKRGLWNRYRIAATGPRLRTWINGVPAADLLDPLDLSGHIALQVHSGNNTHVRWRDLKLVDLGTRSWQAASVKSTGPASQNGEGVELDGPVGDGGWRVTTDAAITVGLRLAEGVTGPAAEGLPNDAPVLEATPSGWWIRLPATPDPREVAICAVDERVSVFVDGKRIADLREASAPRRGRLVFGANLGAQAKIEQVGPAR